MTLEMPSRVLAQCARCAGCVRAEIYQLASTRGFSRVSRLTRANLNMFFCCANGVHATGIVRETSDSASVIVANLLLCTVIVDLAFDRLAANFVVFSVSEETVLTGTRRGVIIRLTFGVTAAEYYVTSFTTLRLSNIILNTFFVV